MRGSHSLSARKAWRTKSSTPEGPKVLIYLNNISQYEYSFVSYPRTKNVHSFVTFFMGGLPYNIKTHECKPVSWWASSVHVDTPAPECQQAFCPARICRICQKTDFPSNIGGVVPAAVLCSKDFNGQDRFLDAKAYPELNPELKEITNIRYGPA